jgi:small-conductance mechanosensitive channel
MIWDRFKDEKIDIPFPQSDLHISPNEFEKVMELFSAAQKGLINNG